MVKLLLLHGGMVKCLNLGKYSIIVVSLNFTNSGPISYQYIQVGSGVQISANPLIWNDNCQTALDIARAKRHSNVVRAIEVYLQF